MPGSEIVRTGAWGASWYCRRRSALPGAIPDDSRRPVAPGRALLPAEAVEWWQCRDADRRLPGGEFISPKSVGRYMVAANGDFL